MQRVRAEGGVGREEILSREVLETRHLLSLGA